MKTRLAELGRVSNDVEHVVQHGDGLVASGHGHGRALLPSPGGVGGEEDLQVVDGIRPVAVMEAAQGKGHAVGNGRGRISTPLSQRMRRRPCIGPRLCGIEDHRLAQRGVASAKPIKPIPVP